MTTEANTVLSESEVEDCRMAPSGTGPRADEWKDKPHRLVYDLCATVKALRAQLEESEAHNRVMRDRLIVADGVYDARGEYTMHAQTAISRATSDLQSRLSEVEREKETLIYWLLRAYQSGHREGWEQSPSTDETMDSICSVLANRGYDPNLSDEAKVLMKQNPRY